MFLYQGTPSLLVVASLLSAVLSGLIVTWLIRSTDNKSVASVRRFYGLLFVSTLVWLVPVVIGLLFSSLLHGAATREFVFGAFLAWGFELVVINGAFLKSTAKSVLISAVHPVPILLLVMSASTNQYLLPVISGAVVLIIVVLFLSRVDSIKTNNGISSLEILRAFLKTWVGHEPEELETYFSRYAKPDSVATDVIIAQAGQKRAVIVLPGIHPGPFSPVGSYNLSELIYGELKDPDTTPIVLHGTGGHERNVPTNKIASDYAARIAEFARTHKATEKTLMRGPLRSKVGITNITTLAFGKEVLAIVSNSPYQSDDLDPVTVTDASEAASELGLSAMVVDAHNSVDGEEGPQEKITRDEWNKILSGTVQLKENDFKVGVANSEEIGFKRGYDISDGGISVTIFATQETKNVLVSADSNNATSGLRERVEAEVTALGMSLLDLCTSDTHKLAARNMTSRGYFALGEQDDSDTIVDCIKKLIGIAEGRLDQCYLQVARLRLDLPLIGAESLDDFATLTKNTISLSKRYTKAIIPAFLLLLAITLFY
jgi:putative membrane protein